MFQSLSLLYLSSWYPCSPFLFSLSPLSSFLSPSPSSPSSSSLLPYLSYLSSSSSFSSPSLSPSSFCSLSLSPSSSPFSLFLHSPLSSGPFSSGNQWMITMLWVYTPPSTKPSWNLSPPSVLRCIQVPFLFTHNYTLALIQQEGQQCIVNLHTNLFMDFRGNFFGY